LKGAGVCAVGTIKLVHVRRYDDGAAGPHSFTSDSATLSEESGRLIGDLALLTRPYGDVTSAVDFSEVEKLATEALELVIHRLDLIIGQLGIVQGKTGKLHWSPWIDENDGLMRKPTRGEVLNLEGESRLLYDAIATAQIDTGKSIRLLAAFGIFCCERALDAETRKHIGTIIEMYSAAGVLLGHANYLLGCSTESGLGKQRYEDAMRERSRRRWQFDPTQKIKDAVLDEWKRWQLHRSLYRYPRDFRREMQLRFPSIVDGTLKNWMSSWGKTKQ
jgi:hypothetical protein